MMNHAVSTRIGIGLTGLALALTLAVAPQATAFTIAEADLPDAGTHVDLGFAQVDAVGNVFDRKVGGTVTGVGIAGGYVGGEIDTAGESIVFTFGEASVITSLDLTYLFQSPNHEDAANEAARILARAGDATYEGILQVVDGTSATWSFVGGGAVTTVSVPTTAGEGWFSIANPFGDLGIDALELLPVNASGNGDYRNADYAFVGLAGRPVPEPGTVLLVGAGLAGLGLAGRKRA